MDLETRVIANNFRDLLINLPQWFHNYASDAYRKTSYFNELFLLLLMLRRLEVIANYENLVDDTNRPRSLYYFEWSGYIFHDEYGMHFSLGDFFNPIYAHAHRIIVNDEIQSDSEDEMMYESDDESYPEILNPEE